MALFIDLVVWDTGEFNIKIKNINYCALDLIVLEYMKNPIYILVVKPIF